MAVGVAVCCSVLQCSAVSHVGHDSIICDLLQWPMWWVRGRHGCWCCSVLLCVVVWCLMSDMTDSYI